MHEEFDAGRGGSTVGRALLDRIVAGPGAWVPVADVPEAGGWGADEAAAILTGLQDGGWVEVGPVPGDDGVRDSGCDSEPAVVVAVTLTPWGAARLGVGAVDNGREFRWAFRTGTGIEGETLSSDAEPEPPAPSSACPHPIRTRRRPLPYEPSYEAPEIDDRPVKRSAGDRLPRTLDELPRPTIVYLGGPNPYREEHPRSCRCVACLARWPGYEPGGPVLAGAGPKPKRKRKSPPIARRVSATQARTDGPRPSPRPNVGGNPPYGGRLNDHGQAERWPRPPDSCPACGGGALAPNEYCEPEARWGRMEVRAGKGGREDRMNPKRRKV